MDEVNKNMDSSKDLKSKEWEIDLIEITKTIWKGKKIVLSIVIIFSIIGLIIAFGTKVEYTSICKILPESQNDGKSSLGGLGGLAGLAGINLNMSNNNSLSPDLYPQIAQSLPFQLKLMHDEEIDKFYLSHLNYAGRGNRNRKDDATFQMTREALDLLFEACWQDIENGIKTDYVTGNNDADGVYLLHWVEKNHPEMAEHIKAKLQQWGGNSSGVNVANIDNLGEVHPDTYWWHYSLGNVKQRPFSEIWMDTSDPMMKELKKTPRTISGRCHSCSFFNICGGNTRIRAMQLTGDPWSEDPGCYLTDEEIGLPENNKERNTDDAIVT